MVPESARSLYLDAARAFAALLVFSSHARGIFLASWREQLGLAAQHGAAADPQMLRPGHQAVIVFFVLSGFFVGGSVLRGVRGGRWFWPAYCGKRLARLWLVLVPAILLTLALDALGRQIVPGGGLYAYHAADAPMIMHPDGAATILGNLFFVQGILTRTLGSNNPLWSLAYEFWYYLAFPCLVLAATARRMTRRIVYLALLAAILVFVGFDIARYFLIWLMGLVPHLLRPPGFAVSRWVLLAGAGLTALLALALLRAGLDVFAADLILGAAFAAWCWLAKHAAPPRHQSLSARMTVVLSESSYTLYLVHMPALVFLSALLVGRWRPWPFTLGHLPQFAAVWGGVLGLAFALYFLFERNTGALQRWVARRIAPSRGPSAEA